jgi:hypothetical protein
VIYLFLEGVLVGEAFCTEFLGRRVSVWEAQAERLTDTKGAKVASEISLSNRQEIQQEALQGSRAHKRETKRLEKQRQLDREQQEIHPSHVQATLQALKEQRVPTHTKQQSRLLPAVLPEDDPEDHAIVHLKVRKLRKEDD